VKIRNGFVSNSSSSSSSYLVVGFYINPITPITEPNDDYYMWWDENEINRVKLAKELRASTGESRVSVYDPSINTKQGESLIVGYKLGYGDSPMEIDIEDMEKLSDIVQKMKGVRNQPLLADYVTENDCIKIIAGEEGTE